MPSKYDAAIEANLRHIASERRQLERYRRIAGSPSRSGWVHSLVHLFALVPLALLNLGALRMSKRALERDAGGHGA